LLEVIISDLRALVPMAGRYSTVEWRARI